MILLINKQANAMNTRNTSISVIECLSENKEITKAEVNSHDPGKKNNQQEIIKPLELYWVDIGQIPRF
tara:strand:- start:797 stop:1000 length:204 start_codon:yes stop_codon:yes gene_type:complete